MPETKGSESIFDKPRVTYADALKHLDEAIAELDRAELVKAAEKTWAATLQATNAFIAAQTGAEPAQQPNGGASGIFDALAERACESEEWDELMDGFSNLHHILHDTVICERDIEPVSVLIQDIRDAADYIRECERLAGVAGG